MISVRRQKSNCCARQACSIILAWQHGWGRLSARASICDEDENAGARKNAQARSQKPEARSQNSALRGEKDSWMKEAVRGSWHVQQGKRNLPSIPFEVEDGNEAEKDGPVRCAVLGAYGTTTIHTGQKEKKRRRHYVREKRYCKRWLSFCRLFRLESTRTSIGA